MVKALLDAIKADRPRLAPAYVWRAYAHLDDYKGAAPVGELTQLVALVRRVAGLDTTLRDQRRPGPAELPGLDPEPPFRRRARSSARNRWTGCA